METNKEKGNIYLRQRCRLIKGIIIKGILESQCGFRIPFICSDYRPSWPSIGNLTTAYPYAVIISVCNHTLLKSSNLQLSVAYNLISREIPII